MATAIRIILHDDVEHLGSSGDVVRVRPGYARNFLIPRRLAALATPGNLARVDDLKAKARERQGATRAAADAMKAQLEAVSVKIVRQVGEGNKMYGSVTSRDIEDAYAEAHKLRFDRRKLELAEPIRKLGLSEVPLQLHQDVRAVLRVEVVKQT